jgi:hypothetical protein
VADAAAPSAYGKEVSGASRPETAARFLPMAMLCLAGAVAASTAVLLIFQSRLTFFVDDWEFLLDRRGFSAAVFLNPHNDHIAIAPVAIYKGLLELFGMSSALPFAVVGTLVFELSVVLLFVYLRRRVGVWPALLGSVLILFLGAAWYDLLWSFQIGFSGSVAAGIGALLLLERDDRKGDLGACALLVVATSFSELGVPFVVGALVYAVLGPSPWLRRLRRLYVGLVPLVLYGLWYLGWGHKGPHTASIHNLLHSPKFVFDAISENLASLFGLATPLNSHHVGPNNIGLNWGRILFAIAIVLAIWRLWRVRWRPSHWLWVALAAGASFWFLTALNAVPYARTPTSGRYQYPGAIFVLLIAAELLRGARIDRRILVPATVVTLAAAVSGYIFLHDGYVLRKYASNYDRARLTAAEIARGHMSPSFPIQLITSTPPFPASSYFSAVDAFGSPAFSESQLAKKDEVFRSPADQLLAQAEGIKVGPAAGAAGGDRASAGCNRLDGSGVGTLALRPGTYTLQVRNPRGAAIQVARFADVPSYVPAINLGVLYPGALASPTQGGQRLPGQAAIDIPSDRSPRPWRLYTPGPGAVTVCRAKSTQSTTHATSKVIGPKGVVPSAVAACLKAGGARVQGPKPAGSGKAVYAVTPSGAVIGVFKGPNLDIAGYRQTFEDSGFQTEPLQADPAAFGILKGEPTPVDLALLARCT